MSTATKSATASVGGVIRKPNGFTWAKFFSGSEPKTIELIHYQMAHRYRYCALAECHPKYVDSRLDRVKDDCPAALHNLAATFSFVLRRYGWEEAKKRYQKIKDFKRP